MTTWIRITGSGTPAGSRGGTSARTSSAERLAVRSGAISFSLSSTIRDGDAVKGRTESLRTLIPEAWRSGGFPVRLASSSIRSPRTEVVGANGQISYVRQPFANNQIPQSLINPVARNLFAANDIYPLPLLPWKRQQLDRRRKDQRDGQSGRRQDRLQASPRTSFVWTILYRQHEAFQLSTHCASIRRPRWLQRQEGR